MYSASNGNDLVNTLGGLLFQGALGVSFAVEAEENALVLVDRS